jgi:hypothetical protein
MHMTFIRRESQAYRFGRTVGASLGIAALAASVGCGGRDSSVSAQPLGTQPQATPAAQQAGAPVVVSCEPHQRTLVRPVVLNGATLSQVECITNDVVPVSAQAVTAPAAVYRPARTAPVYDDLADTRVVSDRPARVIPARQVVYQEERPVRKTRSVKKSAIIIGSSAGAGAGVGALIGGKKGALIGAAVGGGGATVWDQITRRDR